MKYLTKYEYYMIPQGNGSVRDTFINAMVKLTEDEAINYVTERCSEWLEYPTKINRRVHTDTDHFRSKPVHRVSRDCVNYYTLIMDNSPEWKDYPKRSNSFICSMNTSNYNGTSYIVIPRNGSKWGVCDSTDIYDAFFKGFESIGLEISQDVTSFLEALYNIAEKYDIQLSEKNYEDLKSQIEQLDKILTYRKTTSNNDIEIAPIMQGDMWQKMLKIFDPNINKFNLFNLEQLYNRDKHGLDIDYRYEVWTDSPCLFVKGQHNTTIKVPFMERLEQMTGKMKYLR